MTNLKKYTLSDLQEKKIAVKLKSRDEYNKLYNALDCNYSSNYYEDQPYYGVDSEGFGYLYDTELPNYTILESIDEIDLGDEGKEDNNVREEAHKAANRSQFMSNHTYDHKSYEDGFYEGMSKAPTVIATDADCVERIQQLESEIARLKGENEELETALRVTTKKLGDATSQDLTKRERMAWELYVSGFNHGIADKWTIEECFRSADIFINHTKSKEVGNG